MCVCVQLRYSGAKCPKWDFITLSQREIMLNRVRITANFKSLQLHISHKKHVVDVSNSITDRSHTCWFCRCKRCSIYKPMLCRTMHISAVEAAKRISFFDTHIRINLQRNTHRNNNLAISQIKTDQFQYSFKNLFTLNLFALVLLIHTLYTLFAVVKHCSPSSIYLR